MTAPPFAALDFADGGRLEAAIANLLDEETDAIVNAANSHLAHGGGVAAAIARAAGPALVRESEELVRRGGPIPVGAAAVTGAGRLRFRGVVHAVGPMQGEGDEENKLVRALQSAFEQAAERGWRSLSLPAVSSGIFAVPLEVCARAYVRAAAGFFAVHPGSSLRLLRLCVLDGPLVQAVRAEMNAVRTA